MVSWCLPIRWLSLLHSSSVPHGVSVFHADDNHYSIVHQFHRVLRWLPCRWVSLLHTFPVSKWCHDVFHADDNHYCTVLQFHMVSQCLPCRWLLESASSISWMTALYTSQLLSSWPMEHAQGVLSKRLSPVPLTHPTANIDPSPIITNSLPSFRIHTHTCIYKYNWYHHNKAMPSALVWNNSSVETLNKL